MYVLVVFVALSAASIAEAGPVPGPQLWDGSFESQFGYIYGTDCPIVDCQVIEELMACPYSERVGTTFMNVDIECPGCRKCSDRWEKQQRWAFKVKGEEEEGEEDENISSTPEEKVLDSTTDLSTTTSSQTSTNSNDESAETGENGVSIEISQESHELLSKAREFADKVVKSSGKEAILLAGDPELLNLLKKFLENVAGPKLSMQVLT